MKNNKENTNRAVMWYHFLILLFTMSIISGCYALVDDRVEVEKNEESRYYTINPTTILEQLDQGSQDVFTRVNTPPTSISSAPFAKTLWRQADYFRIAQALYQQIWPEPFDAQHVYYMNFTTDCAQIEQGLFSKATVRSYILNNSEKEETRVEYYMDISPLYNLVFVTRGEYTPNVNKKKSINLSRYRIPAEEALQIAEKNGGTETRLNNKNACIVDVEANEYYAESWDIYYQIRQNDSWWKAFEITVNAQTREYKILRSKP